MCTKWKSKVAKVRTPLGGSDNNFRRQCYGNAHAQGKARLWPTADNCLQFHSRSIHLPWPLQDEVLEDDTAQATARFLSLTAAYRIMGNESKLEDTEELNCCSKDMDTSKFSFRSLSGA
ncbi:hypothetical protein MPTK1_7g04410 [Marchantia polymorpha subsp. ruderalis]|uniref:Uncharacterized protein n=2 Tax=Marchantia polymorpha TaxID=3197 RepID=A0AAF6BW28_MARPO|nr:hypothetical protein MARPO_0062s0084 [Marchantia polymorpha]BBN16212.1 hypothetical protein Mp_7g04410 [Marchantia polymorpha subsp. ruderalis]|eukprot:PTQ36669.1 hypothetical protein MARPO_0062s0084 [Marchantia polymorpha]